MKLSRDHIVVLCFIACIALPLPLDRALAALGVALPGNLLSREAGVVEFLLKPGSHRDLADLITRLLRRQMAGRG